MKQLNFIRELLTLTRCAFLADYHWVASKINSELFTSYTNKEKNEILTLTYL